MRPVIKVESQVHECKIVRFKVQFMMAAGVMPMIKSQVADPALPTRLRSRLSWRAAPVVNRVGQGSSAQATKDARQGPVVDCSDQGPRGMPTSLSAVSRGGHTFQVVCGLGFDCKSSVC